MAESANRQCHNLGTDTHSQLHRHAVHKGGGHALLAIFGDGAAVTAFGLAAPVPVRFVEGVTRSFLVVRRSKMMRWR